MSACLIDHIPHEWQKKSSKEIHVAHYKVAKQLNRQLLHKILLRVNEKTYKYVDMHGTTSNLCTRNTYATQLL